MKLLLLIILKLTVQVINVFFCEFAYRMGHLCCAFLVGLYKFGLNKIVFFLVSYFVILEFVSEKFILSKSSRQKYYREGKEIIAMIKEEITRRKGID